MAKYPLTPRKRLYAVWREMIKRCTIPENPHYYRYGGRGISVCREWMEFQNFYEWAHSNGYDPYAERGVCTIERIDNDGNYCPENCRWATYKEQANNKSNNYLIEYNGETKTVNEWSDIVGIKAMTIYNRLEDYGFTVAEALGFEKRKDPRIGRKHTYSYVPIIQCDLNGNEIKEWASVQVIKEELGIEPNRIWNNVSGISKSCEGYLWKRKYPPKNIKIRAARHVIQYSLKGEFIKEYKSAKEAAKAVNGRQSAIMQCCNRKLETSAGYIWRYKDSVNENDTIKPVENYIAERWLEYNGVSMRLFEWAELYNINYSTLKGRLDRGWPIEDALGITRHKIIQPNNRIKVNQYDSNGTLLKEWEGKKEIVNSGIIAHATLNKYIKLGTPDTHGWIWKEIV